MAEEKGHSDALQDEQLIEDWAMRNLLPILQKFKADIEEIQASMGGHGEMLNGIVGGFKDAATNYRRSNLAKSLDLGEDYDGINSIYKDLEGSDLKEDFIDYIMENNISDEEIEEMKQLLMSNAKGKYGRYKRMEDEPVAEPEGGLAIEIEAGPAEEPKEEVKEEPKVEKKDPVMAMKDKLLSVQRGKK